MIYKYSHWTYTYQIIRDHCSCHTTKGCVCRGGQSCTYWIGERRQQAVSSIYGRNCNLVLFRKTVSNNHRLARSSLLHAIHQRKRNTWCVWDCQGADYHKQRGEANVWRWCRQQGSPFGFRTSICSQPIRKFQAYRHNQNDISNVCWYNLR